MERSPITTAVIAVAGWGTRWLPLTKSIEKCMLPVGSRPVVDWVVEDCVRAGITRIIFIIAENHTQIRQYYSHHAPLEEYLTAKAKLHNLEEVRQPQYEGIHFEFMVQPAKTYGTAIPVAIATTAMKPNESFVFLNGDDFIYRPDGGSEVADLVATLLQSGAEGALMAREIPREEATKYGVIFTKEDGALDAIHEKPSLEALAHIEKPCISPGKYIISPAIQRMTAEYVEQPLPEGNSEYYLTDVLNQAASVGHRIAVHHLKGEHLDAGTPDSWLKTNQRVMHSA